jgi:hypothetical protein
MESVATDAGVMQVTRYRERLCHLRNASVESSVEASYLRQSRIESKCSADCREVVRLVQWCKRNQRLKFRKQYWCHSFMSGVLHSALDDAMAKRV